MATRFTILLFVVLAMSGCNRQRPEIAAAPISGSTIEFVLQTGIVDGRMAFVGQGGAIDGIANPDLVVDAGTTVGITIINGDGIPHDLSILELGVKSPLVSAKGAAAELRFTPQEDQAGTHVYFCTVSGHRQAGMAGHFIVRQPKDSGS